MSGRETRREKEHQKRQEAAFLQWEALPLHHIQTLLDRDSPEELQRDLKDVLGYRNHQTCMREAVLLDYYTCGLWWAKGETFTPTQTSFIMAVLHMLLENIRDKQMTLVDNLTEFAKALSPACQCTPSEGSPTLLLDHNQAAAFIHYITNSVIRKHGLYRLVVSSVSRVEQLSGMKRNVEVLSRLEGPTPLEEGIPTHLLLE